MIFASNLDELQTLVGGVDTDFLVQRWFDYLDTNSNTDLTGLQIDEAERVFLLEKLNLVFSKEHTETLWMIYFDNRGITEDHIIEAFIDWVLAGGADTTQSEVTFDSNLVTFDSALVTWDGSDGV